MLGFISQDTTFWWVAIAVAFVVVAVVAALLTLLLRILDDVEARLARLGQVAEALAGEGDVASRLDEADDTVELLRGEIRHQRELLERG